MSMRIPQLPAQYTGRKWRRMSEKDGRTNAREECHAPLMPGRPQQLRLLSRTRSEDRFDELFGYL